MLPGREAAGAYGGTFGGTCGKGGWWSIPDPNGDFGRQWGHRGTCHSSVPSVLKKVGSRRSVRFTVTGRLLVGQWQQP